MIPSAAAAVHGRCGASGRVAVGFFANGAGAWASMVSINRCAGLFFGGGLAPTRSAGHRCVTTFVVIYVLGFAFVSLVQKILGNRVALADETNGLDMPEIGALGYQGDVEPEDGNDKS